jgi:maleate isomerase
MELLTPGWRARFGLIYMHSSIVMEPEFVAFAPAGVSIHTTRIKLPKLSTSGLISMSESEEVERCTELLAAAPLNVILFGGTSASFIKGLGWDKVIIERMKKHSSGIPATTTSRASVNAMQKLQVQKIAIATPYTKEINERAERFFNDSGFHVTEMKGMGI